MNARWWLRAFWKCIGKWVLVKKKIQKISIFGGLRPQYHIWAFGHQNTFLCQSCLKTNAWWWSKAFWKCIGNRVIMKTSVFRELLFSGVWGHNTIFGHLGPKTRFWANLALKWMPDGGWRLFGSVLTKEFSWKYWFSKHFYFQGSVAIKPYLAK